MSYSIRVPGLFIPIAFGVRMPCPVPIRGEPSGRRDQNGGQQESGFLPQCGQINISSLQRVADRFRVAGADEG
jgi:hypothetical protein